MRVLRRRRGEPGGRRRRRGACGWMRRPRSRDASNAKGVYEGTWVVNAPMVDVGRGVREIDGRGRL